MCLSFNLVVSFSLNHHFCYFLVFMFYFSVLILTLLCFHIFPLPALFCFHLSFFLTILFMFPYFISQSDILSQISFIYFLNTICLFVSFVAFLFIKSCICVLHFSQCDIKWGEKILFLKLLLLTFAKKLFCKVVYFYFAFWLS